MRRPPFAMLVAAASVVVLAGCGGSSSSSSSTPESSTAPSASVMASDSSSEGEIVDACTLITVEDLQAILGQDPGAPAANMSEGACGYQDIGVAFTVATVGGFDTMSSVVEEQLTSAGLPTTTTPVAGVGEQAVAYDLGAGNTAVIAKNATWAVNVAGPAPVEQLAAIGAAIFAELDARS